MATRSRTDPDRQGAITVTISSVDQLVEVLMRLERTPSPEAPDFTELDHGLQCAHQLLLRAPDDAELHVAGLVHDIGHQFGDDESHSRLGGQAVATLFGSRVAALVTLHVTAKRYLVTTSTGYGDTLSPVSRVTLGAQGGILAPSELAAFRASRHRADAVTLRRADDAAKEPGRPVPGLDHWLPAMMTVALTARAEPRTPRLSPL